jgi:Phosphotransferase enzyme family
VRWRDPSWLAEATAWIEARVEPVGAIEQPHVAPWSTVIRVPTAGGDLWFKANSPTHRFEARLALLLAGVSPDRVAEVVDADLDRGWLLLRDAGTRLRDLAPGAEQLEHWERLLPLYAGLQLALAPRAEEMLALGVPDERLAGLPARFERLLEDREALLVGTSEGVTEDELERLRRAVPEVVSLCDDLSAVGVAETLQHDDFHDGQVFVADGRYRFLDWGDACVSHPFHTLVVTLRAIAYRLGLAPGGPELARLRDAYLEPFAPGRLPVELVDAVDTAHRTGTIARALAWHRYVSAREPEERGDDAEAVPYGLKRFLAGGPIGSWDPA